LNHSSGTPSWHIILHSIVKCFMCLYGFSVKDWYGKPERGDWMGADKNYSRRRWRLQQENTASNTHLRLTTKVGQVHTATEVLLNLGTNNQPSEPKHTNTHSGNVHGLLPVLHRSDWWPAPVWPVSPESRSGLGGQSRSGRWLQQQHNNHSKKPQLLL
jgi:hypothetical protein